MNQQDIIDKGGAGVMVNSTAISTVMEETDSLTYRGYPVEELAAKCSFEAVAYLIWYGDLPNADQLCRFMEHERVQRDLSRGMLSLLDRLPDLCPPVDVLRTAISALGAEDPGAENNDPRANQAKALAMMAKMPTVVAFDYRRRRGLDRIPPDPELGLVENFFWMCFGVRPLGEIARCFESSLILYAENSFSSSTFTARVVTSTLSDIYSAVTAAIGASKGGRHGGANEAVMHMLLEIGDPLRAEDWLYDALAHRRNVAGFGNGMGKHGDSRVPTMKRALLEVSALRQGRKWVEMYEVLERTMQKEKGVSPNLDFPTGPAYYLMGFDIPMFSSIIAMSRIVGWTAHIIEQLDANVLIRPFGAYHGPAQRCVSAPVGGLVG